MRKPVVWGVAAFGLMALLAVIDRGAASAAERAISAGVTDSGCTSGSVSTTLHGFPMLTQVAGGRLDHVTVTIADVGGGRLPLDSVVIDLYDVPTNPPRVAGRAEMVATVSLASVQKMAGTGWDVAVSDGALVMTGIGRGSAPVQMGLMPSLAEGTLRFDLGNVWLFGSPVVGDQIPAELVTGVAGFDSELDDLPLALQPTAVDVGHAGLVVRAAGTDIALDGAC
jgi:hypothetical protein